MEMGYRDKGTMGSVVKRHGCLLEVPRGKNPVYMALGSVDLRGIS